jgi:hypothetical protein
MIHVLKTYCIINICTHACALIYFSSRSERTIVREQLFGLSLQSSMKSRNNDYFGALVTKSCKTAPDIFSPLFYSLITTQEQMNGFSLNFLMEQYD